MIEATEALQTRRYLEMERFSIMAGEGGLPIPTEMLADLPVCCAPIFGDDPVRVIAINFWAIESAGDVDSDRAWGEFLAEDALRYVCDHDSPEILTAILLWMGGSLHYEERCPGPLENGFVYRVLKGHPDAVDRLFMAVYQQHPEHLH
jgi:hypothetical protein